MKRKKAITIICIITALEVTRRIIEINCIPYSYRGNILDDVLYFTDYRDGVRHRIHNAILKAYKKERW